MMITHEKLLPCPFCGGEAEAFLDYEYVRCDKCHFGIARLTIDEAIAAWNRRTSPPTGVHSAEPWGWLCNGKGDGWEEKDKIVRDPELVAEYMAKPEKWTVQPLYLSPRTELTESDLDLATYIARTIAISMAKNYPEASQWQPADNLIGLLYQISNMSTGLSRAAPTPAVPEGWVMVPKEPTPEMLDAATPPDSYWIGHPWAKPGSFERCRQGHREDAARKYRSMISPTEGGNDEHH